jgi:hypothetical protein
MLSTTSRTARVIAAFMVVAAIAPSANAAPPGDACSLLTAAQVSAALGIPVGAGTYVAPTFKKTCSWNATTDDGGTVTLNLQGREQYENGKKLASYGKSASATPIGDIGDEAYFFGTDKLVSLIVKKGNAAFKIAVYADIPVEKQQAAEKALALQIVPLL